MTKDEGPTPLRIWAILGARAGDNNQVLALAEALQLPFQIKHLHYNALRRLGPRLLGRSLASLTSSARAQILDEPPPDLTLSTGHRSVPIVRALQRRSNGRTRSIHVGFPRVSPGKFDLVITTPQYPVADHPNLLRIPYALTRAPGEVDEADASILAELPAPRRLLIVGGPNIYWQLDEEALSATLKRMLGEAEADGGSVMVTTSPRTPAVVSAAIGRTLDASRIPSLLAAPGRRPRYRGLLAAADSIQVTADSVAMVSDAVWTGKPLALVPVAKSLLGLLATRAADLLAPGRLYPQDLRSFWRALAGIGIGEQPSTPRTSNDQLIQLVMDRVEPILASSGNQSNC